MKKYIALLALGLGVAVVPATATQFIFEDFEFSFNDSNGNAWSLTENVQLGKFNAGFTPTALNLGDWQSNWMTGTDGGYYDPSGPEWSSSLSLNDNSVFDVGQQLALWVFDSASPSGEWALFFDPSWLVTASSGLDTNPVYFGFSAQTQAAYGSFDFDARLASSATLAPSAAVPEPSTYGLFAGLMGIAAVLYKKRASRRK